MFTIFPYNSGDILNWAYLAEFFQTKPFLFRMGEILHDSLASWGDLQKSHVGPPKKKRQPY